MERQYLTFEEKIAQAEMRDYGQVGASVSLTQRLEQLNKEVKTKESGLLARLTNKETVIYQSK